MTATKKCVECLQEYVSRNSPGSQDFAKQKFCSMRCSILYRKRLRHRKRVPDAIREEAEKQGVHKESVYDTISFRNLNKDKSL